MQNVFVFKLEQSSPNKAVHLVREIRETGRVVVGRVEVFYYAFVKSNKEAEQSGESSLCADTSSATALNSDIGDGNIVASPGHRSVLVFRWTLRMPRKLFRNFHVFLNKALLVTRRIWKVSQSDWQL